MKSPASVLQAPAANAPSVPSTMPQVEPAPGDIMDQFQQMLTRALQPMQQTLERHAQELTAMKMVAEQDLEDLEEAMEEDEEEDDDTAAITEVAQPSAESQQSAVELGRRRPAEPRHPPKTPRLGPY